jgi:hypothetical protein
MTEKNKKKKETTPACNGTQLKSYTPLGILFFASVTQRKRYGKKQRRGNRLPVPTADRSDNQTPKVQSPSQRAGIRCSHIGA